MLKEGSLLACVVVEDAEEHVGGQEDEVAAADQQDGPGHLHVSGVQLLQAVLRSGKKCPLDAWASTLLPLIDKREF